MEKLEFSSMEALSGGVDCRKASRVSTVLTGIAVGVALTAFVVGTGGIGGGILAGYSTALGIASGATSIGVGIKCW